MSYKGCGDRTAKASKILIRLEKMLDYLNSEPVEKRGKNWKAQLEFIESLLKDKPVVLT